MLTRQRAFTLLELIITIIIVGVLAALALPRFFRTIERARAAEAVQNLGAIRGAIERCYLMTGDYGNCRSFPDIGFDDPGLSPGSHFSYQFLLTDKILAVRNTFELAGSDPGGLIDCPDGTGWGLMPPKSIIGLQINSGTGEAHFCEGSGFYEGMKW